MCFETESRNESFADQLADALSPNLVRRTNTSNVWADNVSRALANDLAGNRPSLAQRAFFSGRGPLQSLEQHILDRLFSR